MMLNGDQIKWEEESESDSRYGGDVGGRVVKHREGVRRSVARMMPRRDLVLTMSALTKLDATRQHRWGREKWRDPQPE